MRSTVRLTKLIVSTLLLLFMSAANAVGIPVLKYDPLTATELTVTSSSSAIVAYIVTNESRRTHTWALAPVRGISQLTTGGFCSSFFTLGYQQSCILALQISGSALGGDVVGGPKACEQGNLLECYQPAFRNILRIHVA